MRRRGLTLFLLLLFLPLMAFAAGDPNDAPGKKDPPLFSRMAGFHIYAGEELDFGQSEFAIASGKTQTVEGHRYYVDYYLNDGLPQPSGLQIVRNYVNAAQKIGGKLVYQYDDGGTQYATIKIARPDMEVWVQVSGADNGMYKVLMIQKQLMKQDVVADAASLASGIKDLGRVVVSGIYFDTDKATLKPESNPALEQVAAMLRKAPKLVVYVVGHTDNAGTFDHNLKLSQARSASVVEALTTRFGIQATRLVPFGAGPTSPQVSNASEEGRAKNRRVELVAQ